MALELLSEFLLILGPIICATNRATDCATDCATNMQDRATCKNWYAGEVLPHMEFSGANSMASPGGWDTN